jgi:hypothetical protein
MHEWQHSTSITKVLYRIRRSTNQQQQQRQQQQQPQQ